MTYMPQNFGAPVTPVGGGVAQIQGNMPFNAPNVGGMFAGDLAGSYQSAYNTALGQNQANYSNILSGYQQTLRQQTGAQQAIAGGYNQLRNQVLEGIQGVGQSQAQQIADEYAARSGREQQDLINRGLGNSTILQSVRRGVGLDKAKADIALSNQVAQLNAGYQTQLGLAGLQYADQANMQNTGLAARQMDWMNSVQAQYPDAAQYSQLAAQQGAAQQAAADRAQAMEMFKRQLGAAQGAQAAASMGGGVVTRSGGGGLGPGVFGMPGGAGGGLSSVTPFGMGGASVAQGYGSVGGASSFVGGRAVPSASAVPKYSPYNPLGYGGAPTPGSVYEGDYGYGGSTAGDSYSKPTVSDDIWPSDAGY